MPRLWILLGLPLLSCPSVYADRPAPQALRWKAPRGNAGQPPPRNTPEWVAFNGQASAAYLAALADPGHHQPAPLAGITPADGHPASAASTASLASQLTLRGIPPQLAARAAAHVLLGLPTGASRGESEDFLVARKDVVLSYSSSRRSPNWVSWTTTPEHLGTAGRSDDSWRADPSLPSNFQIITFHDFEVSGHDPGHLLPSADRTRSRRDNMRTYLTSNTVPQGFHTNRGPWAQLEQYARDHVRHGGLEAHVLAGPVYGAAPFTIGDSVPVPNATWKILLLLERGQTLKDVTAHTPLVSVLMPNDDSAVQQSDPYTKYLTTPAEIERRTGLRFFTSLPANVADALRQRSEAGPPAPRPPEHQPPATNATNQPLTQ